MAKGRSDLRAAALVGSWARESARMDSDVDVVLLTDTPFVYIRDENWIGDLGAVAVIRTQPWDVLTERRLAMPSGLEVEVDVVAPSWAATAPVDDGTAEVALDGLLALRDPDGLLADLLDALGRRSER